MKYVFLFASILFLLSTCKKETDTLSELEFETQVLNEIFFDLTKTMSVNNGIPKPPPPMPIKNDLGETIGYDSVLFKKQMEKYQENVENLSVADKSVLLAVLDSFVEFKGEDIPDIRSLPSTDYIGALLSLKHNKPKGKLELKSITNTGYFHLEYRSTFNTEGDFWHEIYRRD